MTNYSTATWLKIALAWLGLALFDATQTVVTMHAQGMHHAWVTLFLVTAASWVVWGVATPVVLANWRYHRLPSKKMRAWGQHLLTCVVIGAAWSAWYAWLMHATNPYECAGCPGEFGVLWRDRFFGGLLGDIVIYGTILSVTAALESSVRLAQQEAAAARLNALLAQAQLASLRLQLEPHFIFNALSAVTGLIRENRNSDAIALIASLGDLLRRVTDRSDRQFVALDEELAFLHQYLSIQQMRFTDRLNYSVTVPDHLMRAQVPDFILLPVVENAIKHGIAKRVRGGQVTITAASDETELTLRVYNEGPALGDAIGEGVGIGNTRQRLLALFGDRAGLEMQNHDAGVLVTISLPLQRA